jgi:23S rRNA pseudoU1915 N3-methylase RlmH
MINIVFVSDSSKHFQTAIDEYKKRLDIKLFQIKPTKHTNSQKVIEKDTENINKFLEKRKDDFNILLSLS